MVSGVRLEAHKLIVTNSFKGKAGKKQKHAQDTGAPDRVSGLLHHQQHRRAHQ